MFFAFWSSRVSLLTFARCFAKFCSACPAAFCNSTTFASALAAAFVAAFACAFAFATSLFARIRSTFILFCAAA